VQVARAASDKLLMRETLARSRVPQPSFAGIAPGQDAAAEASRIGFPVVVKPVDNMGARGVRVVESEEALAAAVDAARRASRSSRVILEEYMSGPELSLDAIVWRGRVTVCGVADRHISFPPYFVEMGHTMPSALEPRQLSDAAGVFSRGIAALGIHNGAAKGDIKITPRGAMVGEIAARLSGGYMSGWTFPYASGVEVTEAALRIAMGLPPGDLTPAVSMVSAERAFVSIPGRVRSVEGVVEACDPASVRDLFVLVKPGDEVRLPTNNVQKCGNAISRAPSREAAVSAAEAAVRRVLVRLQPRHPLTEAFLSEPPGPAAFVLERPADREAFDRMPEQVGGSGEIGVLPLPEIDLERGRDWHGEGLASALRRVLALSAVTLRSSGGPLLGRRFWSAFLKGGVQGGVYAVESFREARR
jgi:biotin carboxylase